MMDTRDRMEEVGKNIDKNGEFQNDGKNLFNYITVEELRACTTCNACVEECPVSIYSAGNYFGTAPVIDHGRQQCSPGMECHVQ